MERENRTWGGERRQLETVPAPGILGGLVLVGGQFGKKKNKQTTNQPTQKWLKKIFN